MKKGLKLSLAMLLSLTVVLTGCGNNNNNAAKGETNAGTNAGTNAPKSDFKFGMVTDIGGVNDKSFNQSAWEALQALEKKQVVALSTCKVNQMLTMSQTLTPSLKMDTT